jgi:hypothetical protein
VEAGKKASEKIRIPVLFGRRGKPNLNFEADAAHYGSRTVVEIKAGKAVANYQFLKDLFQASVMQGISFAVVAVRNVYKGTNDFEKVIGFLNTLYASGRLKLPLDGVLIIGY